MSLSSSKAVSVSQTFALLPPPMRVTSLQLPTCLFFIVGRVLYTTIAFCRVHDVRPSPRSHQSYAGALAHKHTGLFGCLPFRLDSNTAVFFISCALQPHAFLRSHTTRLHHVCSPSVLAAAHGLPPPLISAPSLSRSHPTDH